MRFRSAAVPPPKLLCVDDNLGARQFYQRILEAHGYKVLLAEGGGHALHLLRKQVFAAVVCDYEMPGMNGGELAAEIKRSRPRMPFLLISGHQSVLDDPPQGVDFTLEKGAPLNRLLEVVEHLCLSSSPRLVHMADLRRLAPLGQALAGVAVAAFVLPRILK